MLSVEMGLKELTSLKVYYFILILSHSDLHPSFIFLMDYACSFEG